jgi:RNA polymerase sigma-70 factor, ECF subfamily
MNKLIYIGTQHVSSAVQALHGARGAAQPDGLAQVDGIAEVECEDPLLRKPEAVSDQNSGPRHPELDRQLLLLLMSEPLVGLAQIYDQYAGLVYGLARAILTNTQEAEDLTQEIFVGLLGRCAYDPSRGSLASFLTMMTRSRAIDILRSRDRTTRLLETWGDGSGMGVAVTPHEEVSSDESARKVRLALDGLPAAQRQVLEMAYFKGLTQVEIAEALNAPLGTVKTWVRKGLYSLRNALQNLAN